MLMRRGYDYGDGEFATAVAASAFAIHSLEEYQRKLREGPEIPLSRVKNRKNEPSKPAGAASLWKPIGQDNRAPSLVRRVPSTAKDQMQKGNLTKQRKTETRTDAWEKAEMEKVKKRYENMHSEILAWENEKKMRTKRQLEKKKTELELRKELNLQHYRNKLARIEHIAGGARAQAEEKRKYEESLVKERAKKFRFAGKNPVCCFCF